MNNYFKLLDIEQRYDIDLSHLDQQYFFMQSKYHPDKGKNQAENNFNLATSIDLNKAYSTLKDDLTRAEYLLMLNNVSLDEPSARQSLPQVQLSTIWNELELVENSEELSTLTNLLDAKIDEQKSLIASLTKAFKDNDINEALKITTAFKYLKTLISNIKLKIKLCR